MRQVRGWGLGFGFFSHLRQLCCSFGTVFCAAVQVWGSGLWFRFVVWGVEGFKGFKFIVFDYLFRISFCSLWVVV